MGGNKGTPYHHGDLRTALLAAALKLIDRHGAKGFTLKDAAKNAGVSVAAPYRHFADKEALLRVIQAEGFALFNASLREAYERGATAQDKTLELGLAYVRFARGHTAHFRVMFGLAPKDERGKSDESASLPAGLDGYELLVKAVGELMPEASEEARRDHVLTRWSLVHGFALLEIDGAFRATVGDGDAESRLLRVMELVR